MTPSTPKSYVLMAGEAPTGIVLYRKSRLTTYVLRFDYRRHNKGYVYRLTKGSRFYGRLFPQRCDVSPDGKLMVYFAMRGRKTDKTAEPATWTALCAPPWLKALVFCPNGSTWGGGGLFLSQRKLVLFDSPANETEAAKYSAYGIIRDTRELKGLEVDLVKSHFKLRSETEFACPLGSRSKGWPAITRSLKPGVASGYDMFDYVLTRADGRDVEGSDEIILANWVGWDIYGRLIAAFGRLLKVYDVSRSKPLRTPVKIIDLEEVI